MSVVGSCCSGVQVFSSLGRKAKAFSFFWGPYIVTGIVVYVYHNHKASKPIINTRVNTFLSGIVGFAGIYFCSQLNIIYIVHKYKK